MAPAYNSVAVAAVDGPNWIRVSLFFFAKNNKEIKELIL